MLIKPYKIQPKDHFLFDEFMENPLGPHSPNLQRLLIFFRGCGESRYGLLVVKPHQTWVLVSIHAPGEELEIHPKHVFSNIADGEREIF